MHLPAPIDQVLPFQFTAVHIAPPVPLNVPHGTDLHGPLIRTIVSNIQQGPAFVLAHNLVSVNGGNNQRYVELFTYYCEVISGYIRTGAQVDLTQVANECFIRYTCDQATKYNLQSFLAHGALAKLHQVGVTIATNHDAMSGIAPPPAHNQFHQQPPMANQGLTMGNQTPQFNTMQAAAAAPTPARKKRSSSALLRARKPQATTGTVVPAQEPVAHVTQAPVQPSTRKPRSLLRSSPAKTTSDVVVPPAEVNAPAEPLEPVTSLSELADGDSSWYEEDAGTKIDTGSHLPDDSSFTPAPVAEVTNKPVILVDVFAPEEKFMQQHFGGETPPGTMIVEGRYVYTEEAMKSVEPRRYCVEINGFRSFARWDESKGKLVPAYISEDLLVNYEDHELEIIRSPIKAEEVLPYSEAVKLEVVECKLRVHHVEGPGENSITYDRSVLAAIMTTLDEHEDHTVRRAIMQSTSNVRPVGVSVGEWKEDALNMKDLLHTYVDRKPGCAAITTDARFSGRILEMAIADSERDVRSLIDNFLGCTVEIESWDSFVDDFGEIRAILHAVTADEPEIVIDDILNNIAYRASSIYAFSEDDCLDGFKLDDKEIKGLPKGSRTLSKLTNYTTVLTEFDSEDCGVDPEALGLKTLSSAANRMLSELADTIFEAGYAFCDDEPVMAHVELADGVCVVLYRALPGRLPTYRLA